MAVENRTTLKAYFEAGDVPTQAQFENLIDSAANLGEDNDFAGVTVSGVKQSVDTASGTLTAEQSGGYFITSGNITIPQIVGFQCTLRAGGTHTVTFNSTTSPAMATGDLMTIVVESSTVIRASLLPVASQVTFS